MASWPCTTLGWTKCTTRVLTTVRLYNLKQLTKWRYQKKISHSFYQLCVWICTLYASTQNEHPTLCDILPVLPTFWRALASFFAIWGAHGNPFCADPLFTISSLFGFCCHSLLSSKRTKTSWQNFWARFDFWIWTHGDELYFCFFLSRSPSLGPPAPNSSAPVLGGGEGRPRGRPDLLRDW